MKFFTTSLFLRISFFILIIIAPLSASAENNVKTLIAAVPASFPPHYQIDEQGEPYGFAIDIFNAIAEQANIKVSYKVMPTWKGVINEFKQNRADAIPNLGITNARKEFAFFTTPVETSVISILVRTDNIDIQNIQSLSNRPTGSVRTNVGTRIARSNNLKEQLTIFEDFPSALFSLMSGQIDAIVYPKEIAFIYAKQAKVDSLIKAVKLPVKVIKRGIAINKDNIRLQDQLSTATQQFINSNAYHTIYKKWYGEDDPIITVKMVLMSAAIAIFLIVVSLMLWHYKSQVALSRDLKKTVHKLEETQNELYSTNQKLETRVLERTQELSRAVNDANNANNAKSDFMSQMSHELRTPLNAIIGFSQLLETTLKEDNSIDFNNEILTAGRHLLELVNDILDLEKIEQGSLTLNIEKTNLEEVINESVSIVSANAKEQNITINKSIGKAKNLIAFLDSRRFKQVLVNLLSNAIKYNRENGSVNVFVESLGEHSLQIGVQDTGIGISDEELNDIFKPFSRLSKSMNIEGTGIGLTITKELIELMNAKLDVKSKVNEGTTFLIEIEVLKTDH